MAKALSLQQPWAQLVVEGKKTIETRRWNTAFRGEFYIHASKKIDIAACIQLEIDPKTLVTGAIIGKATLLDTKKYTDQKTFKHEDKFHYAGWCEFRNPTYGFILKDAKKIIPVPAKGMLNFFTVNI